MASAGTVTVDFAAETAKFTAELKKVNTSLKNMEGGFASVSRIAKQFIPVLSAGAILSFTKNALAAADALGDVADQIGISVKALSQLQFAAQGSDVEVEQLNKGLTKLSINISDAGIGTDSAEKALAAFNITAQELSGLSLDQQLAKLADQFVNFVPPADRVRVATDLFGKGAEKLVPLLLRGSAGLKEFAAEADRLGISLEDGAVKGIDKASKAIDAFSLRVSRAVSNIVGSGIIDIFGSGDALVDVESKLERSRFALAQLESRRGNFLGPADSAIENDRISIGHLEDQRQLLLYQKARADEAQRLKDLVIETGEIERKRLVDISLSEVSVTGKRVRVPGSPENFDELQQDFDEKLAEDLRASELETTRNFLAESNTLQIQGAEDLSKELNRIEEERARVEQFWRDYSAERHQDYINAKLKLEQGAVNASIGLLRTFAGKSRNAAIALIAVEKGLAIARVIHSTAAGIMAVFADPTIPYFVKPARAAKVKLLGGINIGLIAATGLGEAANIGSGGASFGSAGNPVFTSSGDTSFSDDDTASASRSVTVILNGNVYNTDDFRASVADALKELDDVDTVIFQPNGAQAQTIRNA